MFKKVNYQLEVSHCSPSEDYTNKLYIWHDKSKPAFSMPIPGLEIVEASYGSANIKPKLLHLLFKGETVFKATNDGTWVNKAPGQKQHLLITCKYKGTAHRMIVTDQSSATITLPPEEKSQNTESVGFELLEATYGPGDVSAKLK